MNPVVLILGGVLLLNIFLTVVKLLLPGSLPVKIVILDVLTTVITGVLVFISFIFNLEFLLDIALVYAVLAFAAVLVVSRYMEKGV